ncbi:hypothetical protein [Streptomyces sp. NPDC059176]|uniref:hypothetical protein n=1 Tax=Streptomyces sp. NPDC059176 TaxID=3346758 RepID=UPI0036A6477F
MAEAAGVWRDLTADGRGAQAVGLAEGRSGCWERPTRRSTTSTVWWGQTVAAVADAHLEACESRAPIRSGWPSGWSASRSATATTCRTSLMSILDRHGL